MAITRFQFQGCPAYLKQVLDKRTCEVWLWKQHAFEPRMAVPIDLARNPREAAAADVELDDHTSKGGATTLGPWWPGATTSDNAVVYLLQEIYDQYERDGVAEPVPAGEPRWETQVRVGIERVQGKPEVLRRYHGFTAKLVKREGAHAAFSVWCAGEPRDEPGRQLWVALDDLDQVDPLDWTPDAGGFLALFLGWDYAWRNGLHASKLPRGLSGDVMRFPRPSPRKPG